MGELEKWLKSARWLRYHGFIVDNPYPTDRDFQAYEPTAEEGLMVEEAIRQHDTEELAGRFSDKIRLDGHILVPLIEFRVKEEGDRQPRGGGCGN